MNPFLELLRSPVEAFGDLGTLLAFTGVLVLAVYGSTLNIVKLYHDYDTGGWDVNPPVGWVARLAAVPVSWAVVSWTLSVMFAMLG